MERIPRKILDLCFGVFWGGGVEGEMIYGFQSLESTNCTEAGVVSLDSPSGCLRAWALGLIHRYLFSVRFCRPAVNPHVCVSASARNGGSPSKCWNNTCARARAYDLTHLRASRRVNLKINDRVTSGGILWWLYIKKKKKKQPRTKSKHQTWNTIKAAAKITVTLISRSLTWWGADDKCL